MMKMMKRMASAYFVGVDGHARGEPDHGDAVEAGGVGDWRWG